MLKNIAVILAGGNGLRLGAEVPKQFIKVAGKSVLEHTVQVFQNNENIDEIAIVTVPSFTYLIEDYILANKWPKVKKVLNGGNERYESSLSAIEAYANDGESNLIFHDAVRPLVNDRIINDVINALNTYKAVDTAISSADTIIKVNADKDTIESIPDRVFLRKGQTPQAFRLNTIKKAYEIALKDPQFKVTDDCGVVIRYLPDVKVFVVVGEESNIKLTYKEDVYLLDKLFQLKTSGISRNPDLNQLKEKVVVVFGGSIGIGAEIVKVCNSVGAKTYPFSRSLNKVDIRNIKDIEKALSDVFLKEGKIDCIVNTAALLSKEPLVSMDNKRIDEVLDINLKGVVNVAISGYKYLKETEGHLLFFTSSSYTRGRAFYSLYSATKAAIVNFIQAIASEWEPFNIHVNCINPERTKTTMRLANFGIEPEGALLSPDNVAKVAAGVLCSGFSGQVIDVKKQKV